MQKRKIQTSKILVLFLVATFTLSIISADMILRETPQSLYNFGDTINVPIKILSSKDVQGFFTINLLCGGKEIEVFREYIKLSTGQEKSVSPSVPVLKSLIGYPTTCKIKAVYGDEYLLTDEIKISDLLTINLRERKTNFKPEESLIIEGEVLKETGKTANGFIDAELKLGTSDYSLVFSDTISKGYFFINGSLPSDVKSGEYDVIIKAYEKEGEEISNQVTTTYKISVEQIPINVEIYLEEENIEPGTTLKVKAILRDQAGDKIQSNAIVTIKDNKDKIILQEDRQTDEFIEYNIPFDTPSAEWTIFAVSNRLTNKATFKILDKNAIETEMINNTIIITNKGNVIYDEPLSLKFGEHNIEINLSLGVGQQESYILTAPHGEYELEFLSGDYRSSQSGVLLTGNAVNLRKVGEATYIFSHPLIWVFIILILALGAYFMFKKGYNKTFIAYLKRDKQQPKQIQLKEQTKKDSFLNITNKANQSLSISGEKQSSSIICLKIKDFDKIKEDFDSKKKTVEDGSIASVLQKTIDFAQTKKAYIRINHDCIIYIFTPLITKTFHNEKPALETAIGIRKLLANYNKLAKEKITFGISLNQGDIVNAKKANEIEFMAMGNVVGQAKKLSSFKGEKLILDEKIVNKLSKEIKTQKHTSGNTIFYTITEFKNSEENDKFIKKFVAGLEKEEKTKTKFQDSN